MKLEKRITFITCGLLITIALSVGLTSIYLIREHSKSEITRFHDEEFNKIKIHLKDLVDVAFGVMESYYQLSMNETHVLSYIKKSHMPDSAALSKSEDELLTLYRAEAQQAILNEGLSVLSQLRFDKGNGYFWITDSSLPYPTMVMHAAKPENAGKVMDNIQYNVEKYLKKNIYQARAEACIQQGEAFIEYIIEKPETGETEEKISYSRLYKPLGWIISSGVYTDQIKALVAQKEADMNDMINDMIMMILLIAGSLGSAGSFIAYRFSRQLTQAIHRVKDRMKKLALGHQVETIAIERKDEIGEMTSSLNNLVEGINAYTEFAKEIGQGNLHYTFKTLSDEDILGNELLQMRTNLQKAAEADRKRNWSAEGMAIFGDTLRNNQDNTAHLCDEVLKILAQYLDINQGAIYIAEEQAGENIICLSLISMYAYKRKKHIQHVVEIGEGLIGQCYLEKETTLLYEIPENYIKIRSGLGEATPSNLLLVPLIYNDTVCGILEIASLRRWEPYQIEFIEKICESLGATISAVKVNETTKSLLEQAQHMAEELKAQEEELRQNQEEMQASQEEMMRNQQELEAHNIALQEELQSLKATLRTEQN